MQRDPLGYVDGYNLYAYTANNPINWIDPLGFFLLPPIGTTPPFPKDGSYDFKIPNFIPYIGGYDVSISGSASIGLFNVSTTQKSSIVAGGALGFGLDVSITRAEPNLGSINIGAHRHLTVSFDFASTKKGPEFVGLEFSLGPGIGPPVTGTISSDFLEKISSDKKRGSEFVKQPLQESQKIKDIGSNKNDVDFGADQNDLFSTDRLLLDVLSRQKNGEHPKKRGAF